MEAVNELQTSTVQETRSQNVLKSEDIQLYKRRYYILLVFALLSASNSMQWIEYSVIAHIIVEFYSVSYVAVNWTSMIYMLTYIIFVLPARFSQLSKKSVCRFLVEKNNFNNCLVKFIKLGMFQKCGNYNCFHLNISIAFPIMCKFSEKIKRFIYMIKIIIRTFNS